MTCYLLQEPSNNSCCIHIWHAIYYRNQATTAAVYIYDMLFTTGTKQQQLLYTYMTCYLLQEPSNNSCCIHIWYAIYCRNQATTAAVYIYDMLFTTGTKQQQLLYTYMTCYLLQEPSNNSCCIHIWHAIYYRNQATTATVYIYDMLFTTVTKQQQLLYTYMTCYLLQEPSNNSCCIHIWHAIYYRNQATTATVYIYDMLFTTGTKQQQLLYTYMTCYLLQEPSNNSYCIHIWYDDWSDKNWKGSCLDMGHFCFPFFLDLSIQNSDAGIVVCLD